ncbi:MAG TPA: hypothetical protein EYO33_00510, partial [Phycisphaerales bacterium]|nr:hypothetical protein [Phycisphaerales bacterium]
MPRQMQWGQVLIPFGSIAAGGGTAFRLDNLLNQRVGATLTRAIGNVDIAVAAASLRTTVSWGITMASTLEFSNANPFPGNTSADPAQDR